MQERKRATNIEANRLFMLSQGLVCFIGIQILCGRHFEAWAVQINLITGFWSLPALFLPMASLRGSLCWFTGLCCTYSFLYLWTRDRILSLIHVQCIISPWAMHPTTRGSSLINVYARSLPLKLGVITNTAHVHASLLSDLYLYHAEPIWTG